MMPLPIALSRGLWLDHQPSGDTEPRGYLMVVAVRLAFLPAALMTLGRTTCLPVKRVKHCRAFVVNTYSCRSGLK